MDEIYTEIYEILNLLGNTYINKLPTKLYSLICDIKNNEHKVKFDSLDSISEENCSKEAISMITLFHLEYWCTTEEEKKELEEILNQNQIKNEELKRKLFNPDNIFNSTKSKKIDSLLSESVSLTQYRHDTIFDKIKKFIESIFNFAKPKE